MTAPAVSSFGYREAWRDFSPGAKRMLYAHGLQNVAMGILLIVFGLFVKANTGSDAVLGGSEAATSLALALVCLISAPLVMTVGYRTTFLVAAVAYAASRLGQAAFPVAGALLAFGLVGGLGEGINQAAVTPFLSENSKERHRDFLYSADLFVRVGSAFIGALIGGFLPALLRTWMDSALAYRVTMVVAGMFFASSLIPLAGLPRSYVRRPRYAWRRYYAVIKGFSKWRHVGGLVAIQFTIAVGAGITMPFVSRYLQHELHASDAAIGVILGVTQLAIAVAALTGPWLKRHLGVRWSMVLIQAASLPFLIAVPFVKSLALIGPILWARSALMNMSWPLYNQYSMHNVVSREKPVIGASIAFSWAVGLLIGDLVGGFLMEAGLGSYSYFITAAIYLLGIVFMATMITGEGSGPGKLVEDPLVPAYADDGPGELSQPTEGRV